MASAACSEEVEGHPFWAVYNSGLAENACRVRDTSPAALPNPAKKASSESAKKSLPKLNTADVDCISLKMKSRPKNSRGEVPPAAKYRIQRVENKVAEDLQLSKFLEDSENACDESDCTTALSDSFVSVTEPNYDILSDYGSLHEEKSAVGDFEWTLLDDINETFHVTEKDTDLVVLKSAKSYLLALTSNLGQIQNTAGQAGTINRPFNVRTLPHARAKTNRRVNTATLRIQSSVPEEYYIRKCKPHNLHGRALKSRKGVN